MQEIKEAIKHVKGTGMVIRGNDIDTDQIIPARFMKVVTFDGLGEYAFYDLRFDPQGGLKPHPFNDEKYAGASVMFVNRNFGCGSSREHAPQALMRAGIKAVVGESFAEIFAGNCTAMGVPTLTLPGDVLNAIMDQVEADPSIPVSVDLPSSTLTVNGTEHSFDMAPSYRSALIAGNWDSTSVLLSNIDDIQNLAGRLPYLRDYTPVTA
ncbi:MAG: 3-isopropylmalate dehydratase small subunit [Spirochaeta sp.]|jgi:3-isopropylmalate/(R)-2-methylmalate dehydratase small subunit|nr:3-isopropylmalate dehydratase small subunit [Spirochaeta sp.]